MPNQPAQPIYPALVNGVVYYTADNEHYLPFPSGGGSSSLTLTPGNTLAAAAANTTAIQAALTAGGTVNINTPGIYYTNHNFSISSNTTLNIGSGVRLVQYAGQTSPFLFNANYAAAAVSVPNPITEAPLGGTTRTSVCTIQFSSPPPAAIVAGGFIQVTGDALNRYNGVHEVQTVSGNNVTFYFPSQEGINSPALGTSSSATITGGTFTTSSANTGTVIPVSSNSGLMVGQPITIGGTNTTIVAFTGSSVTVANSCTWANATVYNSSGNLLTIGGTVTGTFAIGQAITGSGIAANTYITNYGTGIGGAGTYYVNLPSQLVSSPVAITAGLRVSPADANITINCEGIIDYNGGNNSAVTGLLNLPTLLVNKCRNFHIKAANFFTGNIFDVLGSNLWDSVLENITSEAGDSVVQLLGNIYNVTVSDVHGESADDFLALGGTYPISNMGDNNQWPVDVWGPISGVSFKDCQCQYSVVSGIALYPSLSQGYIDNVNITGFVCDQSAGQPINIGSSGGDNGKITNLKFDVSSASLQKSQTVRSQYVLVIDTNIESMTARVSTCRDGAPPIAADFGHLMVLQTGLGFASGCNIGTINIEASNMVFNGYPNALGNNSLVTCNTGTNTVGDINIINGNFNSVGSNTGYQLINYAGGTFNLNSVNLFGGKFSGLYGLVASLSTLGAFNATGTTFDTSSGYPLSQTTVPFTFNNCTITGGGALTNIYLNGGTFNINLVNTTLTGNTKLAYINGGTGNTINLNVSGSTIAAGSTLIDGGSVANTFNVNATQVNKLGTLMNNVGSATVNFNNPDGTLPISLATIARKAGAMAKSTGDGTIVANNMAVCDATGVANSWKQLSAPSTNVY
jgi:hypothetical protein